MDTASVICIGSSHTLSVIAAAQAAQKPIGGINLKHLDPPADKHEVNVLHPTIVAKLARKTAISLIGGNVHNEIGLVRHPRPFDFVLPSEPELPADDGELIPAEALQAFLRERMRFPLAMLGLLKKHAQGPVYHMESPPPIGDDDYIRSNIDRYFEKQGIAELGIASRRLRYKLWRLHSEIVRQACLDAGVEFIACPPEAVDGGFLRADLYANATHANQVYGAMLLAQIEAL